MLKIFEISAFGVLSYTGYQYYNLYKLKNIEHRIKTSPSIDLSYEEFGTELDNKEILIATSVNRIIKKNEESENIAVNQIVEPSGTRVNNFKVHDRII
jgi:hypothetical protein